MNKDEIKYARYLMGLKDAILIIKFRYPDIGKKNNRENNRNSDVVKMKILLDENWANLKSFLGELGWNAITVKDVIDRRAGTNSVNDDEVLSYALSNKTIIVTKDKGLKLRCFNMSIPYIDLGSPEQEAKIVDRKLREIQAWKEYI